MGFPSEMLPLALTKAGQRNPFSPRVHAPARFLNGVLCPGAFTTSEQEGSVNKKLKVVATITIQGPGRMTVKGRQNIVIWLRNQAVLLKVYGAVYTNGRYTAKWYDTEAKKA